MSIPKPRFFDENERKSLPFVSKPKRIGAAEHFFVENFTEKTSAISCEDKFCLKPLEIFPEIVYNRQKVQ